MSSTTDEVYVQRRKALIELLESLEPERFDYDNYWSHHAEGLYFADQVDSEDCGTSGCVAGWAVALAKAKGHTVVPDDAIVAAAGDYLGFSPDEREGVFYGGMFDGLSPEDYGDPDSYKHSPLVVYQHKPLEVATRMREYLGIPKEG